MAKKKNATKANVSQLHPDTDAVVLRPQAGVFVSQLETLRNGLESKAENIQAKIQKLQSTMERTGYLLDAMDGFAEQVLESYRQEAVKMGLILPEE